MAAGSVAVGDLQIVGDLEQTISERLVRLEELTRQQAEEIEEQGGALDHVMNTVDTIVLPTLKAHNDKIEIHARATSEAHDYIMSQRGAWSLIQKGGIVIAALAATATLVMKLLGR